VRITSLLCTFCLEKSDLVKIIRYRTPMADEEESGAKFGSWVGSREGEAPHGDGTGTYPNGDVYTGTMVHGQREGQGK
jgi:hypothetical protein